MRSRPQTVARTTLLATALITLHALRFTIHAAEPFDRAQLAKMDAEINQAIAEGKLPGGVLWLEHQGHRYLKAYGDRSLAPESEAMTKDTIFDAASLTKVLATTPAVMLLLERGKVKLDEPAQTYIPEFKDGGKEAITLRQLLTHTSGLRPGLGAAPPWRGYEKGIQLACAEKTTNTPGTTFRYSDINFIVLGEVVRRASGTNLNDFVAAEIFQPLKMADTGYLPPPAKLARIAPTERVDGEVLRGKVHDPTSRRMGGVAGHAGVFTTAADMARFARMMLNGGELDGARLFKAETVKLMTSVQTPEEVPSRRGLGWDIDSGYSRPRGEIFPLGSYGHTGFTGTSIWIDPFSETFWIFLSNRVHPDGKGNILPLQAALATLAAEAVTDFDFGYVPGALSVRPPERSAKASSSLRADLSNDVPGVLNGIDVLAGQKFAPLKGMRLGLITNHTGRNRQRYPTIDLLLGAPDVHLKALFSPEHGLYGNVDEPVGDSVDERTGLPVFSLYGKHRAPTSEQLKDLDALVFDIQDVGCRFYTYISTLGLAMEAAAKAGTRFFVLDRVNPVNGITIDGPVLTAKTSFVGYHPIPVRHGMTVGELARMYKAERDLKTDLTVVPLEGWSRKLWFDETAQPWVNLSPNMRSVTEAILYPGVGLLETTALSVGRGTGTPFEVVGAPYIHDIKLAAELNRSGLVGVRFVPVRFTPTDSVFKGQSCAGVGIMLTDRERCQVVDIGITIAKVLHRLYPQQFGIDKFNRLLGDRATLDAIKADRPLAEIKKGWAPDLEKFQQRREAFLLYK
jgi:uncharacterized protein YbbC (DUF1343 family)/CubicO group peptidase (beta-lactamase class C family)